MYKFRLDFETITPMFCYGADGKTPELRVPAIKGALRFWWRAIHPNFSLAELKKKETEIFGGTGDEKAQKSSFSIALRPSDFPTKWIKLLPHKSKSSTKSAIIANFKFVLILRTEENPESILSLFKLTSILGGIGGRSRRGFGSIKLLQIDNELQQYEFSNDNILKLIHKINPDFEFIEYARDYPYLQKVEIGNPDSSADNILYNISQASHLNNSDYTGKAMGGRYASPIYVSIIQQNKNYYPIISTLKRTIADTFSHTKDDEKKNNFINTILGGVI